MPGYREAVLACPGCGEEVLCFWPAAQDQDETDAPAAEQACLCGHRWRAQYPGYSYRTEA
jgi:hypothetical protein